MSKIFGTFKWNLRNWDGSKKSILQKMKEKVRGSRPMLKERISNVLYKLTTQLERLKQTSSRLKRRDQTFFEKCIEAQLARDQLHAIMYANECAELRRMAKIIFSSEIALEQAILRLQTIEELGDVMVAVGPILGIVQETRGRLAGVIPSIAGKLDEVNRLLSDTMKDMSISTDVQEIKSTDVQEINIQTSTEEAIKVLEEANVVAEQKIKEKFPELPEVVAIPEKQARELVPIALTTGGGDWGRENVLKKLVYEYIKACNGELVLSRCAIDLGASSEEVKRAIRKLAEEGKISVA